MVARLSTDAGRDYRLALSERTCRDGDGKMKNIDWNEAPEWATGHGLMTGSFGIEEVWFNAEQYLPLQSQGGYGPYPFGGGIGPHMHNGTRGQIQFQQHRPAPWSGEGLPPAGTVCEFKAGHSQFPELSWTEVRIVSHDKQGGRDFAVFASMSGYGGCSDPADFRPIRTPEQIAADERLHNVRNACSAIADTLDGLRGKTKVERAALAVVEAMIDAGYRRVEQ